MHDSPAAHDQHAVAMQPGGGERSSPMTKAPPGRRPGPRAGAPRGAAPDPGRGTGPPCTPH